MIKFGVWLPQNTNDGNYDTIRKVALECEKLNFDSLWLNDHFFAHPIPTANPYYECWTILSALASETRKIRLGTLALSVSYRYPSVLAKMAACLDVISNGRLEFGIGAGWYEEEYIAYGIPFPRATVRIEQLREGIKIIKKMWTKKNPSFEGKYYTIKNALCYPKPLQKPHPPIWIGTFKAGPLMLKTIAELADVSNFWGTPEDYRHKLTKLKEYCSNVGRDPKNIQPSWSGFAVIAKEKRELREKILKFKRKEISIDDYTKPRLVGTPEECIEKLGRYVDGGVTYFILRFPDITEIAPLQLFAEKVIPTFKEK